MKKTLSVLLAVCLCVLCGCNAVRTESSQTTPQTTQTPLESTDNTVPSTVLQTSPETTEATVPETAPPTEPETTGSTEPAVHPGKIQDMKALWISQFDMAQVYLDGNTQRSQEDFTARMSQILDNVKSQTFNTVFLQIRPYGDSMYPSQVYPSSACVAGETGGQLQYDPVSIIVSLARQRGLSIHAWINPLRCMKDTEIGLVSTDYAIGRWYQDPQLNGKYLVLVNGRWYLNPAYEEVTELICAGAQETMQLYDFDGLHLDDYFYPTTDTSFDADAYSAYQAAGGQYSLADFRRDNINRLVLSLYELTHDSRSDRLFGISPGGNIDTTYNSQYADVYQWCSKPGYVDYLCPQVYWGLEHQTHHFVKVCKTFQGIMKEDSVALIIGMTFGKAYSLEDQWAGTGKDEWKNHKDILARCLRATLELESCRGVSIFCYQYFFDPLTGQSVSETAQERENFMELFETITWN